MPPQFLPCFVHQTAIAGAVFGDPALQRALAHPEVARQVADFRLAAGDTALDQDLDLLGKRGLRLDLTQRGRQRGVQDGQKVGIVSCEGQVEIARTQHQCVLRAARADRAVKIAAMRFGYRRGAGHLDPERPDAPPSAPATQFKNCGKCDVRSSVRLCLGAEKPAQGDAGFTIRLGQHQLFGRAEPLEPCQPVQPVTIVAGEKGRHGGGRMDGCIGQGGHPKADGGIVRQDLHRPPQREILRRGQPGIGADMQRRRQPRLPQQGGRGQANSFCRAPEGLRQAAAVAGILGHGGFLTSGF